MNRTADDDGVRVGATATAFEIVQALKELDGAGVSAVARHIDTPKTTVFDHLKTLEELGYVTTAGDEYRIGAGFLELGGYARNQMTVFEVGKPQVDTLAGKTDQHANLMIEEHGVGVFLYTAAGENTVRLDTYAGRQVHLQTTALGKSILAYTPRDWVEAILNRHGMPAITDRTITDREELFEELASIRERGYATDKEERVNGMWCIGAPITNSDNEAVGAVSVSAPKNQVQGERFRETLPNQVQGTANVIEVNLTYS
ncbi:IclR family transcriptional regulator [Halobacteriales archaeon QS_8_69_26]|nr:MAG: IclR family transcriptional regulator [Halobacteriales archaeon QS_8_69_26]